MKIIAGFIMGATAVVMVCCFFIAIPKGNKGNKGNKGSGMAARPAVELESQSYEIKGTPMQKNSKAASHGGLNQKVPLPEKKVEKPGQQEMPPESSNLDGGKRFFWKPFSLKSKAKRFAKHITSASGVNCLVEKSGIAEYKVYFFYNDESDRLAKEALIKDTGISF